MSSYVPHIIYSVAITTFSIHLISQKTDIRERQSQITAKLSILESIRDRLQAGERIPAEEMMRLRKLARSANSRYEEEITWKEAMLGKKDIRMSPEWYGPRVLVFLWLAQSPCVC